MILRSDDFSWRSSLYKCGRHIPWEQFFDAIDGVLRDARENISQITFRIDPVQFASSDQAVDRRGAFSSSIGTGEQVVLSA